MQKHHLVLGDQTALSAGKWSPELWSTIKWCDSSDKSLLTQISSLLLVPFALFHKERQENHPEQSVLNISMAGAAEADPAVTSGCSKPRHALKQEVYSAQHKCLFSYDPKWNSAGLTREPCSASCTALLSKVFQKGSQELRQVSSTANSRSLNSQGICELGELLLEFKLLWTIASSCLIKQVFLSQSFLV